MRDGLEHQNERGFSLVELVVVVVILGILVAVTAPIVNGLQESAREAALIAIAAEGATGAVVQLANTDDPDIALTGYTGFRLEWHGGKPTAVGEVCVRAIRLDNNDEAVSGPGCVAD